jgi:uracil-DNA glycosylase family 4
MRTLPLLQTEVASCTKCELHSTRTNTVFARGNPQATLCFVGEAPGEEEDLQGLPFVGRSGQLLDQTLTSLGLDVASDIYVCNIIKCRPPNNRRPTDEETNSCLDYLEEQLKLTMFVNVIVALGSTAVNGLINTTYGITKIRGQFFKRGKILVLPTYHPSYVLRNGSKGPVFDAFKQDLQTAYNKAKGIT